LKEIGVREIKFSEIAKVKCFEPGERPVFLLRFTNGESLVVKAESNSNGRNADAIIPLMAKMMKQVSPQVKATILSGAEMNALVALSGDLAKFRGQDESRKYLELYVTEGRQMFAFYKMPFVENLTDFDKVTTKVSAAFMFMQLDTVALHQLGKIVAVDLFIGNHDRFTPDGRVQNAGNLLFQSSNGRLTPIGLDFYEAQGIASDLHDSSPEDTYGRNGKRTFQWAGMVLQSEMHIRCYAGLAIKGLNGEFAKLQGNSSVELLKHTDVIAFANGMLEGMRALRDFLQFRGGLPSGVAERMRRLGWSAARPTTPPPPFQTTGRHDYVTSFQRRSLNGC
jgi:hypothetical protein